MFCLLFVIRERYKARELARHHAKRPRWPNAPAGIWTRVTAVKGQHPWPLDYESNILNHPFSFLKLPLKYWRPLSDLGDNTFTNFQSSKILIKTISLTIKGDIMNKKFWATTFTLTGTIIGAGILGLPYVFSKAGFFIGLLWLIILGMVMMFVNLTLGEITLRTNGRHQLSGYAEKYLGKWGKRIMFFAMMSWNQPRRLFCGVCNNDIGPCPTNRH